MGLSGQSQRWQGQRSAFSWEQSALEHIKAQMPNAEPYRAWQTFTFTAASGHVREVDLFIATPGGLFLVEIKSHPGTATNDGSTWLFRDGDKIRTIENPLHFTDQKAKELKSQLEKAARKLRHQDPPHRGRRLPVRGDPQVPPGRVPAPPRLRPGQAGGRHRPDRHLDRFPQPATKERA